MARAGSLGGQGPSASNQLEGGLCYGNQTEERKGLIAWESWGAGWVLASVGGWPTPRARALSQHEAKMLEVLPVTAQP